MNALSTEQGLVVRRATPADYDAALPLFERFYRDEGFERAVLRVAVTLRALLERDDTAAFIAFLGGKAVGAAAVSSSYGLETGAYAELEDLFVTPEARHRGIGAALVDAAMAWARERGCSDVEVVVTPRAQANAELMAWYRTQGFADTGRRIFERPILPARGPITATGNLA